MWMGGRMCRGKEGCVDGSKDFWIEGKKDL